MAQYQQAINKGWDATRRGAANLAHVSGGVVQGLGGFKQLTPAAMSIGIDLAMAKSYGMTPIESVGRGLAIWAGYGVLGTGPMLALTMGIPLARAATTALPVAYRAKQAQWNMYHKPNLGGMDTDTQAAQTMRQSSVQAIQNSHMNARSALGGEGAMFARSLGQVKMRY